MHAQRTCCKHKKLLEVIKTIAPSSILWHPLLLVKDCRVSFLTVFRLNAELQTLLSR